MYLAYASWVGAGFMPALSNCIWFALERLLFWRNTALVFLVRLWQDVLPQPQSTRGGLSMSAQVRRKAGLRSLFTLTISFVFLLAGLVGPWLRAGDAVLAKPPETRRDNVKETLHGVEIVDPYRWLEDQESPETRAWIDAQNKYTETILGSIPGRASLKQRLSELMRIDTIGVPTVRNGRYFFSKKKADQDLSVLYLRRGLTGEDEVLIDPHPWSPDHTISVSLLDVARDGRLLAYGVRQGGEDEMVIKLMDVDARKDLPDQLPRARYFGISLTPDNSGFYYTRFEPQGPRVYYHARGTDPVADKEIFGEGYGPEKIIFASLSEDGRHLVIHVLYGSAADRTEIYYQNLAEGLPIVPIVNDVEARFFAQIGGDQLFVLTNWKAPKSRILAVDLKNPARDSAQWREVVPESDAVIENTSLAGCKVFVGYLENVRSSVKVFTPEGRPAGAIPLPALGSVSGLNGQWDKSEAFFAFASFHIPTTIYRYTWPKEP